MLVIKRIHVVYHLKADASQEETVQRVHDMHHQKCPVYRSVAGCIDVTTEYVLEEG